MRAKGNDDQVINSYGRKYNGHLSIIDTLPLVIMQKKYMSDNRTYLLITEIHFPFNSCHE